MNFYVLIFNYRVRLSIEWHHLSRALVDQLHFIKRSLTQLRESGKFFILSNYTKQGECIIWECKRGENVKSFITVNDVEYAFSRGETIICCGIDDVVTAAAKEFAQSKGITIRAGSPPPPPTSAPLAASAGAFGDKFAPARPLPSLPAYHGAMSEAEIMRWREEFPILKNCVHAANCSVSAQSLSVRAAVNRYMDNWLTKGMDWDYWMVEIANAKAEFAKLIGATPEEIFICSSVSDAVASVISSLDYSGGRNRVVTTEIEFPTVGHVLLASAKRFGFDLRFIPSEGEEIAIEAYEKNIDEQTLISFITHVYYRNGFKQDVARIADICHGKGSLVMVDSYQALGTTPVDVKQMHIDILASGCIKYLFGVPGITFVYINKDLATMLNPAITGWFGQVNPFSFEVRKLNYAMNTYRFDTGTPAALTSFAAGAGIKLANDIGQKGIAQRIDYLSEIAILKADQLGLKCVSPRDVRKKGGTTAIEIEIDSHHMEMELHKRDVLASARGNVIRIAPHFYTLPHEVEYAFEQIRDIIDHGGH